MVGVRNPKVLKEGKLGKVVLIVHWSNRGAPCAPLLANLKKASTSSFVTAVVFHGPFD